MSLLKYYNNNNWCGTKNKATKCPNKGDENKEDGVMDHLCFMPCENREMEVGLCHPKLGTCEKGIIETEPNSAVEFLVSLVNLPFCHNFCFFFKC